MCCAACSKLYKEKGWRPVVAPELEFYLVKKNLDPDYPLDAAVGRSGRKEPGGQAYGIDAANDFDPIVEDIYDYCEAQELDVDTLSHESGPAQLEINFNHGDPLELADQVFLFKRTVRQAALKHDMYATFMAKPHENEPGSSMHIHQSVMDIEDRQEHLRQQGWHALEAFPQPHRRAAALSCGGAVALCAERQLLPPPRAGFRCAHQCALGASTTARCRCACRRRMPATPRVENRVPGADANPYLAFAASLACGYLGMIERIKPSDPVRARPTAMPTRCPSASTRASTS